YLAIGNEQWGNEYFKRYEAFERVLSEKHPEIKLITSAGWTIRGDDYDCAVKWMTENKDKAYAVDEHFYKLSEWFFENIHRYDSFDRTMPKVFAGEYAAHSSTCTEERRSTWECALAEAAFLTGAEKNSDHVIMTCYAPLLAKKDHQQWQPNLIWFDNTDVYLTPSYHVQKLFSRNIGDYIVNAECDTEGIETSVSVSEDNGRLFIKLVNASECVKEPCFDTDCFLKECRIQQLCAAKASEYASLSEYTSDNLSRLELPPFSVTVISCTIASHA
ncbi:MAG: alpha-L-arabinofuranosidase C-terminal domain-containing protein, partial [Candidatus Ornithomonoglobus sp.]